MDKLIELLNQYEIERGTNRVCYGVDIGVVMSEGITYRFSYVISKEFGFIKRLVDNDKIDKKKIPQFELVGWYTEVEYSEYENLLMVLSIQDNPIEFLISILK